METICPNSHCRFDLSLFPITIELDSQYRNLCCPICGSTIEVDIKEVTDLGVFYDEETRDYVKWASPMEAAAHSELVDELDLGQLKIRIRAKTRDFQKIFYEAVLVFIKDNEIFSSQLFAPPENYRKYGIRILPPVLLQPNGSFLDVRFELKGGFKGTIAIPAAATHAVTDQNDRVSNGSALLVWPDFKRPDWKDHSNESYPGWKDYFVYFATADGSVRTEWMRIVGKDPSDQIRLDGVTPKGELGFAPEYIELSAEVTKGGMSRKYKASFAVGLKGPPNLAQPTKDKVLHLAVDFGTSNTCFYYLVPGQGPEPYPQPLSLNDRTHSIVKGLELESDLRHTWLPGFKNQTLIPSELTFPKQPHEVFNETTELRPVTHYTIPPLKWRSEEQKLISTGFKWQQSTEPSLIAGHYLDLQEMYLGLVLRLAIAELVSRDELLGGFNVHPCKVELTITYPLAMSEAKYGQLLQSWERARTRIGGLIGVTISHSATVDESLAGEIGTVAEGAGQRIFIDVGGGTTDIAVVEQLSDQAGTRETFIVDSVRYAGNDFLLALSAEERGAKISSKPLIELQRRIRAENQTLLQDRSTFNDSQPQQDKARAALNRFLGGLTQYLARIVAFRVDQLGASSPQKPIDIYLLGNGWRFASFASNRTQTGGPSDKEAITQELKTRLVKELELFKNANIISDIPQFAIHHPADPKTVVARGALLAVNESSGDLDKGEPRTFMGSDVKVVLPGKSQSLRWNSPVPRDLGASAVGVYISNPLIAFESPRVPDYQFPDAPMTNLDEVNIGPSVHENGRLVKNAFNVYLERWYKRFLSGKWI